MKTLKPNQIITNPLTAAQYRIQQVLGEGGFGRVYAAQSLNRRGKVVDDVCLKTTLDQGSWHRESYFGELLKHSPRVIRTYDSFPLAGTAKSGILFCLVMELADHGTVADYLEKSGKPWTEKRAVREIVALLKVLDQLHGASATHRDLTPMNVFACGSKATLKLGDFGIARHEMAGYTQAVEAFNPDFVTQGFRDWKHRHWYSVDDVYQMGQLLAVLLLGDTSVTVNAAMITKLDIDPALKRVLKCAIGRRSQRYADAYEFMQALLGEQPAVDSRLQSLEGKTVVFTGPLSLSRYDAHLLVLQAGGEIADSVTKQVDVVVQGKRSMNYKDGHKGAKLQKAQTLRKKGQQIAIIGEAEFRRLVKH